MAVREILLLGNPILRQKCGKVKDFTGPGNPRLIRDLQDTLGDFRKRHGFGRGIAAPQIGVAKRIVFIDVGKPLPLINPEITKRSRESMALWDDCFSFPDILVKVRRSAVIMMSFQDDRGRRQSIKAEGGLSELLQHEIDHLDGILAIDRAIAATQIILRSEWEKLMKTSSRSVRKKQRIQYGSLQR